MPKAHPNIGFENRRVCLAGLCLVVVSIAAPGSTAAQPVPPNTATLISGAPKTVRTSEAIWPTVPQGKTADGEWIGVKHGEVDVHVFVPTGGKIERSRLPGNYPVVYLWHAGTRVNITFTSSGGL
ncbi:MAG: hypothetical protein ACI9U2_004884, partial [Bradymonadia bacterium]